jgi:CDP-diacylglycerol---glycerol-3-phosphate 3-phosphatidyltransferase
MNLPNKLSVARLFCVPFFLIFTYTDNVWTRLIALGIFIGAGVTDLYDGYLARKHNLVTPLGIFLDPLADKLIVTAALIAFVELKEIHVPSWMVVLIVGREFILTGLRALAATKGNIVAADDGGKFKTSVQTVAIIMILVVLIVNSGLEHFWGITRVALHAAGGWRTDCARIFDWTPYWMSFITTVVSLGTGLSYLRKNKSLFEKDL